MTGGFRNRPKSSSTRRPKRNYTCGKRRFRDHAEAVAALRTLKGKQPKKGHTTAPVRAYECERCGGWHLTSRRLPGEQAA